MFMGRLFGAALLIGAGTLAVGAVVAAPHILRAARPVARQGLKHGMELYARVRAAAAEFADDVEDLVAEVQAERTSRQSEPEAVKTPEPA